MLSDEFGEEMLIRMETALRFACQRLPASRHDHSTRKFIAERILASARSEKSSLQDLMQAGIQALKDLK